MTAIDNYAEAVKIGAYRWTLPVFLKRDGGARTYQHGNVFKEHSRAKKAGANWEQDEIDRLEKEEKDAEL